MTLTAINSLLRSPNRYTPPTASLQAVVRPLLHNKKTYVTYEPIQYFLDGS